MLDFEFLSMFPETSRERDESKTLIREGNSSHKALFGETLNSFSAFKQLYIEETEYRESLASCQPENQALEAMEKKEPYPFDFFLNSTKLFDFFQTTRNND